MVPTCTKTQLIVSNTCIGDFHSRSLIGYKYLMKNNIICNMYMYEYLRKEKTFCI